MFRLLCWIAIAGLYVHAQQCANITQGVVIGDNYIDQKSAQNVDDCCDLCQQNYQCIAFTFKTDSNTCFLKDNADGSQQEGNRISGIVPGRQNAGWYACQGPFAQYPFCDTTKSLDSRLNDLVSRINLTDFGHQLTARESPNVDALGIPAYYWGTNAIHGVQNTDCLSDGQCPTAFPAPCSLSATFNMSLVKDMGSVIGQELRAMYNIKHHNSLNTWSPTINLNRDPRWGRNVESCGEDPLLCGDYGVAYTTGLQNGSDPSLPQAIVTLKHWIAYSLESYGGYTRHTYNAIVSEYDLQDSFFPAFKRTVQDGHALGIMCSYNELNGVPTCGNPNLTSILRDDWGFQGYITSDTDAVGDIWSSHHYEPTGEKAVRDALEAGCDINSGSTYQKFLESAVDQGIVDKKYADQCLYRAYKMRFLLGLFDPNVTNAYRKIPQSVVGSQPFVEMSLNSARKSMVLLKNANDILPFKTGQKVAVMGTSSNSSSDILGNYNGPLCPGGGTNCIPTIYEMISSHNSGGTTTLVDDVKKIQDGVNAAQDADVVVLVASNAADGGGEGHDRTSISLASDQQAFADAVLKVGKPTVLVLINGGIIAIDDLKDSAPAIIEAFMPGVTGAQALAETIFGDNNPGGKMPVTMYYSNYTNQIDFLNMSMTTGPGRSYRYYNGTPIFPFGYGLSYTTFRLEWSPNPPIVSSMTSQDSATTYECTVTNTGKVAGDEVVFAYFHPNKQSIPTLPQDNPVPIKQLFGYQRVSLAPGQSTKVSFTLNAEDLALVNKSGDKGIHKGTYDISLSRGHGNDLHATVMIDISQPIIIEKFKKFW